MPLHGMLFYDLDGKSIVVNPCRDQNYRKYFEMRKKYNITTFMWLILKLNYTIWININIYYKYY